MSKIENAYWLWDGRWMIPGRYNWNPAKAEWVLDRTKPTKKKGR